MYNIEHIYWSQIQPIWRYQLWPDRESPIESHSTMTWPVDNDQPQYDMSVFNYQSFFIGAFIDNKLVGVNSGHRSSNNHFRSRGLWVDQQHRKHGIAQMLFAETERIAKEEGCNMIWSMPRKTALSAYQRFGFKTVGEFFGTETAESNIYVIKML